MKTGYKIKTCFLIIKCFNCVFCLAKGLKMIRKTTHNKHLCDYGLGRILLYTVSILHITHWHKSKKIGNQEFHDFKRMNSHRVYTSFDRSRRAAFK